MRKLILILLLAPASGLAARLQSILALPPGTVVKAVKIDSAGDVYLGGYVRAEPGKLTLDLSDAFVSKLSSDGSRILFRTVLPGVSSDEILDIALGADGSIHATGYTYSRDFPVTAGAAPGGTSARSFYARFDAKGSLVFATLLGGDAPSSSGEGIAADSTGAVYITGHLGSPASGAYVTKLDAAGGAVFTSTVTGGNHIALDSQGNIYVAGTLLPPSLVPTTPGAFQVKAAIFSCANSSRNLPCHHQYVSKLDPSGKQLLYSTFVAGNREEGPMAMAVDPRGNVYLAGSTTSTDYPVTPGAYQPFSLAGPLPKPVVAMAPSTPDPVTGYITKLNPAGSNLVFSTYLGGSATDSITALALDSAGNVYAAGAARSEDFPGLSGVPRVCTGGGFVTRLSADGSALSATQLIYGVAVLANSVVALDPAGRAWIAQAATISRVDLFATPPRFACAVDSADFAVLGQVAPGQLVSLFGHNLGLGDPVAVQPPSNRGFPLSLAGVSASFNGIPAPIFYVSPSQINVQAPFELSGQATARLRIALASPDSTEAEETRDFSVTERAPSVFVLESGTLRCGSLTVTGQHPAALNADGTLNTCGNPAVRGSIVTIFFQGVGVTSPAQTTGALVAAPAQILDLPLSNMDGSARFVNAASVPGAISGVWALQLRIPNGFTTNFTVGGAALRETSLMIWNK